MDSWSRGGNPREGLATSKPPSFHFTVGISITGFFWLVHLEQTTAPSSCARLRTNWLNTASRALPLAKTNGHCPIRSHPIKKLEWRLMWKLEARVEEASWEKCFFFQGPLYNNVKSWTWIFWPNRLCIFHDQPYYGKKIISNIFALTDWKS